MSEIQQHENAYTSKTSMAKIIDEDSCALRVSIANKYEPPDPENVLSTEEHESSRQDLSHPRKGQALTGASLLAYIFVVWVHTLKYNTLCLWVSLMLPHSCYRSFPDDLSELDSFVCMLHN